MWTSSSTATNPTTAAMMKATSDRPHRDGRRRSSRVGRVGGKHRAAGRQHHGSHFRLDPTQVAGKRLEILKGPMPALTRVAVLWNPAYGPRASASKGRRMRAASWDRRQSPRAMRSPEELEPAFARVAHASAPRRSSSCRIR